MSSTEITFSGVARIEIERTRTAPRHNWVSIKAFDGEDNEVGEVTFFPSHKGGRETAPTITADCHIPTTEPE